MGIEFGNEPIETQDNVAKITPEQMDNAIKNARTPEQFLSNYEFDERSRDVIVFRKPHLRDIQIYDICKFVDNTYGLVVMMQSLAAYNVRCNTYQYSYWAKNTGNFATVNMPMTLDFDSIDPASKTFTTGPAIYQLTVIQLVKDPKSFPELITACNGAQKVKVQVQAYQVSDVCEIHKNLYRNLPYADEVLATLTLNGMRVQQEAANK